MHAFDLKDHLAVAHHLVDRGLVVRVVHRARVEGLRRARIHALQLQPAQLVDDRLVAQPHHLPQEPAVGDFKTVAVVAETPRRLQFLRQHPRGLLFAQQDFLG